MFATAPVLILAPNDEVLSGWKAAATDAQHDWKHRDDPTPPANAVYMGRAYATHDMSWVSDYLVAYFKAYSIIYYMLYLNYQDALDAKTLRDWRPGNE